MTLEPSPLKKSHRPVVRGLCFGLAALGLRLIASVIVLVHALDDEGRVIEVTPAVKSVAFLNLASQVALLVSVGYAAIAAQQREWGRALVATWIVIAATGVLPFVLAVR